VHEGIPLSEYERRWKAVMGREMRVSTQLRRRADRFMRDDFTFHLIMRFLGAKGIKDIITCRIPKRLGPLMY
jgi:hypothetical protein